MTDQESKDPLHGVTLEAMILRLVEDYGWEGLAERIPVRCFQHDPSVKSSLHFLRRTPWAREKVEKLYLGKLKARKPARPKTGAAGPKARPAGPKPSHAKKPPRKDGE